MKTDIRTSDSDLQQAMTFAYAFPVTVMVAFAFGSNIISIDTFRRVQLRSTTVGLYLLIYSCCALFGTFMLECRLFQLLDSLTYIPFFIICNVVSGLASIFTRICLWMIGLIALQRSLHSFEHNRRLNRIRSRAAAPKQILVVISCVFAMHIHELICRVTLPDPILPSKFVCQIKYSSELLTLNKVFTFLHLSVPFSMNILANCLILASISRRRATLHQTTYWTQWLKQFRHHGHLFVAPTFAMVTFFAVVISFRQTTCPISSKVCTLPQLILSMKFACVDVTLKWLLRLNTSANLIIYLPQAATFFLFIYPSENYFNVFQTESLLGKLFRLKRHLNQQVLPLTMRHSQSTVTRQRELKITMENKTKH